MEFIAAKTMVTKTKNQHWFGTDYNMNIYRGCNHGCIYCDSRSDCYQIEDFDRVRAKKNSIELLERELSSKRKTGVIGTGAMSDPYNSFEKEYKLSRVSTIYLMQGILQDEQQVILDQEPFQLMVKTTL